MYFTNRSDRSNEALIRQGKDLVTYALVNAVAMRKISKKYDKVWLLA
jgi:E3 ubiquitin-protein ligase BAH